MKWRIFLDNCCVSVRALDVLCIYRYIRKIPVLNYYKEEGQKKKSIHSNQMHINLFFNKLAGKLVSI